MRSTSASLKDSALTNVDTAKVDSTDGTDGNDQIAAGLGAVHLSGNGGVDTIGTANDSPLADSDGIRAGSTGGSADKEALYRAHDSVLVGGAGGDILKSGSANDKVFTGSYAAIGESDTGSGDAATDANTVNTGTGSDTVYGSNGLDFVTTASTAVADRRRSSAAARTTSSPAAWAPTRSTAARVTTTSWRPPPRSAHPARSTTPSARLATWQSSRVRAAARSCSSAAPAATASTAPTARRRSSVTPPSTPATCSPTR